MPKTFPEEQRLMIKELYDQGMSHVEIARTMNDRFPAQWKAKSANRTVARILGETQNVVSPKSSIVKTLDQMTKEERTRHIEARLQATPRFRMAFKNFGQIEKDVFVDEYLQVVRSTETLTEAEEQALFAAVLELVLAFQVLNRKQLEERLFDDSLAGNIPRDDPRFRSFVDPRYQREYDQHMKLFQSGMEQLKMSRKDRLKEVRSGKQTLLDLAEALSYKTTQSEAANEIERLSKMKDDELKHLLESGYLFGVFDE